MAQVDLNNSKTGTAGKTNADNANVDNVPQDPADIKFLFIEATQETEEIDGEDVPKELEWTYTKQLQAERVRRNTATESTAIVSLEPNSTKLVPNPTPPPDDIPQDQRFIKDFNGRFGFKTEQGQAIRHYFGVVQVDKSDPTPDDGDPYDNDESIVFAGFNKVGATALRIDDDTIDLQYNGMEEVLNDVNVTGIIQHDQINAANIKVPNSGGTAAKVAFTPGLKCIFNEDGKPDMLDITKYGSGFKFVNSKFEEKEKEVDGEEVTEDISSEEGDEVIQKFFNKAGTGSTKFWTSEDMLDYVIGWYTAPGINSGDNDDKESVDTNLPPEYFGNVAKMPLYIRRIQIRESVRALLRESTPMKVDIENMGAWEAMQRIVEASKNTVLHTSYDGKGRVSIEIKSRDYSDRSSSVENPLVLSVGDFGGIYDKDNLIEKNSTLALDRSESNNVGKVIVLGGNTRLNVLMTTMGAENSLVLSRKADSLDEAVNPEDFTLFMDFMLIRDSLQVNPGGGVEKLILKPTTYNWIKDPNLADEIPFDPGEINEDTEALYFGTLQQPFLIRAIQPAFSQREKDDIDVKIYVSDIVKTDKDSGKEYISIIPIEDSAIMSASIIQGEHGGIEIKNKKNQLSAFQALLDASPLKSTITSMAGIENDSMANPLPPVFVLCTIVANWKIKGIDEIPNFNPNLHQTIIIEDDDYFLALNNTFAEYDSSNRIFNQVGDVEIPLENGDPDGKALEPLEVIQKRAERILGKYVNAPQNTGSLVLTGVQPWIQVGDPIDRIHSGYPYNTVDTGLSNRDIEFPTVVNTVEFVFDRNAGLFTVVTMGSIDDGDEE